MSIEEGFVMTEELRNTKIDFDDPNSLQKVIDSLDFLPPELRAVMLDAALSMIFTY